MKIEELKLKVKYLKQDKDMLMNMVEILEVDLKNTIF